MVIRKTMDLSMDTLVYTLRNAISQDSSQFQPASQTLKQSERIPGFHFHLLKCVLAQDSNIEVNVRWLAALYLKNGIDRHWRNHGPSPIQADEKKSIRNEVLGCFEERVHQISLQMAVVVSKMARYDIPRYWPELFPNLFRELGSIDPTTVCIKDNPRLLVFRYLMKELSTKKLPNDRKVFSQVSCGCFEQTFKLWQAFFTYTVKELCESTGGPNASQLLDKTIHMTKALRYMWESLDQEGQSHFFSTVLSNLKTLLEGVCTSQMNIQHANVNSKLQKLLLVYSKIVDSDNETFHSFAKDIFAISRQCMFVYAQNRELFQERFVVNSMNQVKTILSVSSVGIISLQNMEELLRTLVFSYLPLTTNDLEQWEDDAEEFCSEEIGETWKYNLRPSAEVLFMTFLHSNPNHLVPVILSTLQSVNESSSSGQEQTLEAIRLSDAVYTAVGLAAIELFDRLDFEKWFVDHLLPRVQQCQGHPYGKIIHRRVLWLIEQWMGVKPPAETRPLLYNFIISSLESNVDMVVRLSASSALRQILDEFEFDMAEFSPYQERCTDALYNLLKSVQSGDCKMRVLHVLSFVIERLGTRVISCINKLAQILPEIWMESEAHNMLRCAVVSALINVVVGLKEQSVNLHPFLLTVVHHSTDVTSPAHVYLLADGLELWIAVLQNATQMSDDLLRLFGNMFGLLEISSESLKECLHIVECYVVLGGADFVASHHGPTLAAAIQSLVTDVRDECLTLVTRLITRMVQVAPVESARVFAAFIHATLGEILRATEWSILATSRLLLVARLALHACDTYWALVEAHGSPLDVADHLLRVFCDRIDSVVETEQRKVVSLAALLMIERVSLDLQALGDSLPRVLCVCVQVLHDVCEDDKTDVTVLTPAAPTNTPEDDQWEHAHSLRMRALMYADPNHKISLVDLTRRQLTLVQSRFTSAEVFEQFLIDNIDQQTLKDLRAFL